ncbi:MAG: helix-hairpin-helix domain-containing protein [Candidatus Pacearchaeota archaeon]
MAKDFLSFFAKRTIALFLLSFFVTFVNANCSDGQIDINTASVIDLQKLVGIGPAYAQRIIEERPFSSIEELIRIKGIGEKTLQKIKEQGLACVSVENTRSNMPDVSQSQEDKISENLRQQLILENSNQETQNSSYRTQNQQQTTNTNQKIDINTASVSLLTKITGVGEKTAQEIIKSRPFCSIDDLLKVKGIGQKTLEKIKEQGVAYVEDNFCKTEENEEKVSLNLNQKSQSIIEGKKSDNFQEELKKESIINLNSNKEENKTNLATGKVVYESKTEKIRKYAIYFFAVLLVVIVVLILKD